MRPLPDDIRDAAPFRAFLEDMAALGVTQVAGGGVPFAVVAARSNPRWWLLPLDNRRVAAMGLEMLQPMTHMAQLAKIGARTLAQFGQQRFLGRGQICLAGLTDQPDLQDAFGGKAAHIACFTGTDGPHRKTALQIMDSAGTILGYAKLTRVSRVRPYLRNEASMLRQLAKLDLRTAEVPALIKLRDDDAVTLLITDSLRSAGKDAPLLPGLAHLSFLNELRSKSERPGAEITLKWLTHETARVRATAGVAWTMRLDRVVAALLPFARSIPVCLTHGDFTPWNCFLQQGRLYVFDWEYANPSWPVGFDLAHFMLATIPLDQQPDRLPDLLNRISSAHFGGNKMVAWRALLLSLSCHAVFYLGRLLEAGSPMSDWIEWQARATMLDRLLAQRDTLT
jgi:hypothetical protein